MPSFDNLKQKLGLLKDKQPEATPAWDALNQRVKDEMTTGQPISPTETSPSNLESLLSKAGNYVKDEFNTAGQRMHDTLSKMKAGDYSGLDETANQLALSTVGVNPKLNTLKKLANDAPELSKLKDLKLYGEAKDTAKGLGEAFDLARDENVRLVKQFMPNVQDITITPFRFKSVEELQGVQKALEQLGVPYHDIRVKKIQQLINKKMK